MKHPLLSKWVWFVALWLASVRHAAVARVSLPPCGATNPARDARVP